MRSFRGTTRADLITEINRLEAKIDALETELKHIHELKNEPSKNERNAGRKTIITDEMTFAVDQYRKDGLTYRQIADEMGISVGLVHKIYNRSV